MSPRPKPHTDQVAAPTAEHRGRRWLLFVHQLPPRASNLRVRVWRRLQQIGAVVIKQAVYALPDSPGAREDFEWLKAEVEGASGHASVFAAESIDTWSDDALVEEFRRSRQDAYAELARDAEQVLGRHECTEKRERVGARLLLHRLLGRIPAALCGHRTRGLLRECGQRSGPHSARHSSASAWHGAVRRQPSRQTRKGATQTRSMHISGASG